MRSLLTLIIVCVPLLAQVPTGEVTKYTFDKSKIFPGTTREYWVYIPKQYDGKTPACVYVNQDGIQFNAVKMDKGQPVPGGVLDALIHEKKMPVTIAVFVRPGVLKASKENSLDRFNRSFEYDGLGDAYARFLLEELLPEVETKTASDGRKIVLSKNGNDRAIGGSSSGAVCAFTVAWERPDEFRRVFSSIGTYVGLRGANEYPTIIRKYEPKPIRIYLQDGSGDLNIYGGDWWMANQSMERSLKFMGYEVEHNWGTGGHNGADATKLFPEAMAWLWKDHPNPVKAGTPQNDYLKEILIPGEEWKLVGEGYKFTEGPAVNAKGEVFFNDVGNSKTYKIVNGKPEVWLADSNRGDGQAFGPDGKLYAVASGIEKILAWDADGKSTQVADGFKGNDLVALSNGSLYVTHPGWDGKSPSQVWHIAKDGTKTVVDKGLKFSNGITVSPDQSLLYVADSRSHWVYSYQIQPDGSLKNKQKYYHLHVRDTEDESGADGMRCDRDGRLWVATKSGLQVCDQAGRVHCILPTPNGKVSNLTFGGADYDTVYATCGDKVYSRKVKVKGANAWDKPLKPVAPRL